MGVWIGDHVVCSTEKWIPVTRTISTTSDWFTSLLFSLHGTLIDLMINMAPRPKANRYETTNAKANSAASLHLCHVNCLGRLGDDLLLPTALPPAALDKRDDGEHHQENHGTDDDQHNG